VKIGRWEPGFLERQRGGDKVKNIHIYIGSYPAEDIKGLLKTSSQIKSVELSLLSSFTASSVGFNTFKMSVKISKSVILFNTVEKIQYSVSVFEPVLLVLATSIQNCCILYLLQLTDIVLFRAHL
jgi:hypothetical protein